MLKQNMINVQIHNTYNRGHLHKLKIKLKGKQVFDEKHKDHNMKYTKAPATSREDPIRSQQNFHISLMGGLRWEALNPGPTRDRRHRTQTLTMLQQLSR